MDPLAVDLLLLQAVLAPSSGSPRASPDGARGDGRGLGRGSLSIAGALIEAELPKEVQAGQDLRLRRAT